MGNPVGFARGAITHPWKLLHASQLQYRHRAFTSQDFLAALCGSLVLGRGCNASEVDVLHRSRLGT